MATGSIRHPYQAAMTCEICEGTKDVDSYCLMCKGPMCGTCVATHTRTPMFRKHKIVQLVEGLQQQVIEEECGEHPTYICSMHCNVCRKIICIKCISSGKHNGHDMSEIQVARQKVQQEIKVYHDTLKNAYLPQYRTDAERITQEKTKCRKMAVSRKSDITNRCDELITQIHKVRNDMLSKVDDEEKQQSLQLDKSLQKLQESIKETEILMTQSMEAQTEIASKFFKFNRDKPSLSQLDVQEVPETHLSTFAPGTINIDKLAEQIGKLVSDDNHSQIDTAIIHRAKFDKAMDLIITVDRCQAWVTSIASKELRLIDSDGKVVKRINTKFDIHGFAVSTSGEILATDYHGGYIRTMAKGQITRTIDTNPNKPSGVCLGDNDQEIVTCVNTLDGKSKLLVYGRDGREKRTMTYTDKPYGDYTSQRVTLNNRGDYCVGHHGHDKVYVLDTNGGLRWTYDGSGAEEIKKDFVLDDICCDIYNNLIISDCENHRIHMLDDEGKFLRFILTEQDGIVKPMGLCIDTDGRLWVGQLTGGLSVVKYKATLYNKV